MQLNNFRSTVRLGEHNVLTDIDCEAGVCADPPQDFNPKLVIVHQDYGNPPYKHDIALIRLDRPAVFNGNQFLQDFTKFN